MILKNIINYIKNHNNVLQICAGKVGSVSKVGNKHNGDI